GGLRGGAERRSRLGRDLFVGVEPERPVAGGVRETDVSGLREVVVPRMVDELRAELPRDLRRRVGGPGIDDDDLVDELPCAGQAAAQEALLILYDHDERDPRPTILPGALLAIRRDRGDRDGRAQRL